MRLKYEPSSEPQDQEGDSAGDAAANALLSSLLLNGDEERTNLPSPGARSSAGAAVSPGSFGGNFGARRGAGTNLPSPGSFCAGNNVPSPGERTSLPPPTNPYFQANFRVEGHGEDMGEEWRKEEERRVVEARRMAQDWWMEEEGWGMEGLEQDRRMEEERRLAQEEWAAKMRREEVAAQAVWLEQELARSRCKP